MFFYDNNLFLITFYIYSVCLWIILNMFDNLKHLKFNVGK